MVGNKWKDSQPGKRGGKGGGRWRWWDKAILSDCSKGKKNDLQKLQLFT